jgi:Fe-S oxidoreductase/nitrate reductase gamma subunit
MEGREAFWNISGAGWMYLLTLIALLFFFYGIYKHLNFWRKGDRVKDHHPFLLRLRFFLSQAFLQRRIFRKPYNGVMHLFIFWGCLILFFGTLLLAIQNDLLGPIFGLSFLHGNFYMIYSFALDLFGLLALVGTGMALIRRYFLKKDLRRKHWADSLALWLLFFILVTGFAMEWIRIGVAEVAVERSYPLVSQIPGLFQGVSHPEMLRGVHRIFWWVHLFLALILIAMIPYTKLFHMLSTSFLTLSRVPEVKGALTPVFLEPLQIKEDRLTHLSRHQLIGLDACTQCQRCEETCPVTMTNERFSPLKILQELKRGLYGSKNNLNLLKETESLERVWECLTCRYCEGQCPVSLEIIDKVIEVRRHRVMEVARFPAEIKSVFRTLETFADPWAMGQSFREDWIQGEKSKKHLRNGNGFLVWVGCQSAFHERNKRTASSFTKLLDALDIDYFLLGKGEVCCGDLARRTGNEYLSRNLILKNIETFHKYGVQKIVTLCPHCFHVIKEEYPHWGGRFEVMPHSEFIAGLIAEGMLSVPDRTDRLVTYHDSCYLGRYHGQFDPPRAILKQILKGDLIEMEKNRSDSLCCGAGGGSFWLRGNSGEKINRGRLEEIRDKRVQVICTSCPYCLVMFEEAIRNTGNTDLAVMDLVEFINLPE